jgi:SAM-dependent methyltransferase
MPEASAEEILDVNVRYHDLASESYDSKWGIDYGAKGAYQVLGKMRKALGQPLRPMGRGLEIGAGTGYFSLNLLKQGILSDVTCTDVSPGMLEALSASAEHLHLDVETVVCDAENLPFEDCAFDAVISSFGVMFASRTLLIGVAFIALALRRKAQPLAWLFFADAALMLFEVALALATDKLELVVGGLVIGALEAWAGRTLTRARSASR